VGLNVHLVDNGAPVARQTRRMLPELASEETPGQCVLLTTGDAPNLQQAAKHWLHLDRPARTLSI